MKYTVIGAGGVGGCLGACLAEHGKDVCLIDRGEHLQALQINGLQMDTDWRGKYGIYSIEVSEPEQYRERADAIFVCARECSTAEAATVARNAALPETVVVLLSDSIEGEELIRKYLPDLRVYTGNPQVSAYISKPGTIRVEEPAFLIDFQRTDPGDSCPVLEEIAEDLRECGINVMLPG